MNTLRFEGSQQLKIETAEGDVAITGWDHEGIELTLDGELEQCTAEHQQHTLTVSTCAAVAIRVPRQIQVHVGLVSGDLLLRKLDGRITVDDAHGDVSIRESTDAVVLHRVHGSLAVQHLGSKLSIDWVGVDTHVQEIAGPLILESGEGRFQGHELYGGLQIRHLKGDLALRTAATPGQEYRAQSDGQIRAWFPAETSARFHLQAKGSVVARLPKIEEQEPTKVVGQAGAGEANVILHAGTDLTVQVQDQDETGFDAWSDMDSIAAQIEAEITEHLGKMSGDAAAHQEIDRAMRHAEQEMARVQRQIERETQRAEHEVKRAQQKAARAARRAQEKIARKSRSWGAPTNREPGLFGPPVPRHSKSKLAGASDEEQLAVLKMLQEKKISIEEAEQLLAALEG